MRILHQRGHPCPMDYLELISMPVHVLEVFWQKPSLVFFNSSLGKSAGTLTLVFVVIFKHF